jgi:hypothetical protein
MVFRFRRVASAFYSHQYTVYSTRVLVHGCNSGWCWLPLSGTAVNNIITNHHRYDVSITSYCTVIQYKYHTQVHTTWGGKQFQNYTTQMNRGVPAEFIPMTISKLACTIVHVKGVINIWVLFIGNFRSAFIVPKPMTTWNLPVHILNSQPKFGRGSLNRDSPRYHGEIFQLSLQLVLLNIHCSLSDILLAKDRKLSVIGTWRFLGSRMFCLHWLPVFRAVKMSSENSAPEFALDSRQQTHHSPSLYDEPFFWESHRSFFFSAFAESGFHRTKILLFAHWLP